MMGWEGRDRGGGERTAGVGKSMAPSGTLKGITETRGVALLPRQRVSDHLHDRCSAAATWWCCEVRALPVCGWCSHPTSLLLLAF